ncbi:hypothetical protein D3C76_1600760 [compost metagenome]
MLALIRFGLDSGFVQVVLKPIYLRFQICFQALFASVQASVEGAMTGFCKEERQNDQGGQPEDTHGKN